MIAFDNSENRFKNAAVALNYGRKYAHGEIFRLHTSKFFKGKDVLSKSDVLEKDKKLRGQKYLAKMILLAKCKYFVGSMTQGSKFSYILNNGNYSDEYVFDLGLYP